MASNYNIKIEGNRAKMLKLSEVPAGAVFIVGHGQTIGACSASDSGRDWEYSVADISDINHMDDNAINMAAGFVNPDMSDYVKPLGFFDTMMHILAGKEIPEKTKTEKHTLYNEPINSDKKIVDSKLDFPYYFNHERRPTYGKETTHTGGESPARA